MSSSLRGSEKPLTALYDVALLDLDGVVYIGPEAVPGAPTALVAAREQSMHLAFVTNNAARPPQAVAAHLSELGIEATADEVITSAQAAARYLADRLAPGAHVLVLGTTGLVEALHERGLTPVSDANGQVDAVVQGYSPEMNWRLLAEGAVAINRGALWIATNADPTVPSPRGPLPGNGSLVAAMRLATRVEPVVTGKPDPTMHRETLIRTAAQRPIVVGDRLDTDIEGANAVGCPSLLVFSGVTTVRDLLYAVPHLRPTYVSADVGGLLDVHPEVVTDADGASCGRWRAGLGEGGLVLATDDGSVAASPPSPAGTDVRTRGENVAAFDDDTLDAVRALCGALWSARQPAAGSDEPQVTADDEEASRVLERLGLARG